MTERFIEVDGAMLRNVSQHLREQTGLPIIVADDSLTTVVIGAGKLLTDLELLMKLSVNYASLATSLSAQRDQRILLRRPTRRHVTGGQRDEDEQH